MPKPVEDAAVAEPQPTQAAAATAPSFRPAVSGDDATHTMQPIDSAGAGGSDEQQQRTPAPAIPAATGAGAPPATASPAAPPAATALALVPNSPVADLLRPHFPPAMAAELGPRLAAALERQRISSADALFFLAQSLNAPGRSFEEQARSISYTCT